MMARFGRRRPAAEPQLDDEQWPDEDPQVFAPEPKGLTAKGQTSRWQVTKGRVPKGKVRGSDTPADDLPPSRLRGTEITYAYGVGAVIAIAGIIMLVVTKGKGAPVHPQPIWAALGIVFGVATILSVRFSHRMLTALVAIAGGFVSGQARTPNSLSGIKIVALIAPVLYGVVIFRRQSKADRVVRGQTPRQTPAERRAARAAGGKGRRGAAEARPVPGQPKASGRYTPPKSSRPVTPTSRSPRGRNPKPDPPKR
jgi:hypothetical protein